jgi:hypothetical protein
MLINRSIFVSCLPVLFARHRVTRPQLARNRLPRRAGAVREGADPTYMRPDMSDTSTDTSYRVTADELRQFVERIERLDAEKKDRAEQQKEVMAEAKGRGYDTKVMR